MPNCHSGVEPIGVTIESEKRFYTRRLVVSQGFALLAHSTSFRSRMVGITAVTLERNRREILSLRSRMTSVPLDLVFLSFLGGLICAYLLLWSESDRA